MYTSHHILVYLWKHIDIKPILKVNKMGKLLFIRVLYLFDIRSFTLLWSFELRFYKHYRFQSHFFLKFSQRGGRHYNIIIFILQNETSLKAYMGLSIKFVYGIWYSCYCWDLMALGFKIEINQIIIEQWKWSVYFEKSSQ